jgi:hypothetical protein
MQKTVSQFALHFLIDLLKTCWSITPLCNVVPKWGDTPGITMSSNGKMINVQWIGKDLEVRGRGLTNELSRNLPEENHGNPLKIAHFFKC